MTAGRAWVRYKVWWVAVVSGVGLAIALAFHAEQGWREGRGYPYNTFLFTPIAAYSDFADEALDARLDDPYVDPLAFYGPFAHLVLWALSRVPSDIVVMLGFFVCSAGLFFLLQRHLLVACPAHGGRVVLALFLLLSSYPVIFCFQRGNIELVLVLAVAAFLHFFSRARYGLALACLVSAICCKMYPAVLLALYIRRRRWGHLLAAAAAFLVISLVSLLPFKTSPLQAWMEYSRNMTFLTDYYVYENQSLSGSASPWTAYKVVLVTAVQQHWVPAIDFDFDGPFIVRSYAVYCGLALALVASLAVGAAFLERKWTRGAIPLLLVLAMASPTGADYRLLYAGVALMLLTVLPTRHRFDFAVCILVAVALLPKKYFFFTWLGPSESGFTDVSIQVILNPLLLLGALGLLLVDGWSSIDWVWVHRHGRRTLASLQFR